MSIEQQTLNLDIVRTNADRAACVGRILESEAAYRQSLKDYEPDTAVVDFLADLMHWYTRHGFESSMGDFSDLVRIAGQHFEEEVLVEEERDCWSMNIDYPMEDWQAEVAAKDTRLGYWEWVEHKIEDKAVVEDELWTD